MEDNSVIKPDQSQCVTVSGVHNLDT